jgi:hypothetical protein
MPSTLDFDLKRLRAVWAEAAIRGDHAPAPKLDASTVKTICVLYDWGFVPSTHWPFNNQNLPENLEHGSRRESEWRQQPAALTALTQGRGGVGRLPQGRRCVGNPGIQTQVVNLTFAFDD